MSLKGIAKETLNFLERGEFVNEQGENIDFSMQLKSAIENTRLYTPDELAELISESANKTGVKTKIEVTEERTQVAAKRIAFDERCGVPVLLNFASARNAGGGFLNGAKAQEEDLCRCSGLYPCLLTQEEYYRINRQQSSMLYTDYMIYSPSVPWFRTRSRNLLDDIFTASVITAPAPNAGQCLFKRQSTQEEINETLYRRAGKVLAIAKALGYKEVVLGAWGCGVFKNDPSVVAGIFDRWLCSAEFEGVFNRVTFAIFDSSKEKKVLEAFKDQFSAQQG